VIRAAILAASLTFLLGWMTGRHQRQVERVTASWRDSDRGFYEAG
jgi:hypothetical protein